MLCCAVYGKLDVSEKAKRREIKTSSKKKNERRQARAANKREEEENV
jgi:hypothetical protein